MGDDIPAGACLLWVIVIIGGIVLAVLAATGKL